MLLAEIIVLPLFGKDLTFYALLEQQAEAANRAAQALHALANHFDGMAEYVSQLDRIEHEADGLTHQLANKIDSTFVTPLDKEDLHALSSNLDDITDFIEAAAARIALYRLHTPRPDLEPLVSLLVQITQATQHAVAGLRDLKNRSALHEAFVCVHKLENEGDQIYLQALATLLNAPDPDPIMVFKWKEIYDSIEIAIDKCEDVANIVESVVVKYA